MKKVAILQSNYIPWKGYFDLIASVDEFIIYDCMQYTRRDWRNRNFIKTPQGLKWVTVPVKSKGNYNEAIKEIEINGNEWSKAHWQMIVQNYKKAPFFSQYSASLEHLYLGKSYIMLSDLNRTLLEWCCRELGIETVITNSADYKLAEGKSERLADLCLQAGGTEYVSGPAAKEYVDEEAFSVRDLKLTWFSYEGYVPYPQLWGDFEHKVTILDLLFNCGQNAKDYMRFIQ